MVTGMLSGYNISVGTKPLQGDDEPLENFYVTGIGPTANYSAILNVALNFPHTECLFVQVCCSKGCNIILTMQHVNSSTRHTVIITTLL